MEYGSVEYWNDRYSKETEPFEWYQSYEGMERLLTKYIVDPSLKRQQQQQQQQQQQTTTTTTAATTGEVKETSAVVEGKVSVLVPGCGNSQLSERIYASHCRNVVSFDISETVITAMIAKYKHKPGMTFKILNMTKLQGLQDNSFDVIVDKGGLDSLICGENAERQIEVALTEYQRVLKPNGIVLIVSYGSPDTRTALLQNASLEWDVLPVVSLPKPSIVFEDQTAATADSAAVADKFKELHYVYICRKWVAQDDATTTTSTTTA